MDVGPVCSPHVSNQLSQQKWTFTALDGQLGRSSNQHGMVQLLNATLYVICSRAYKAQRKWMPLPHDGHDRGQWANFISH